jgi:hypothetical protein
LKRGGLEDFSRTKEDEMTAATFDHQVGKSLEFFEQQRNEKTACARFIETGRMGARLNILTFGWRTAVLDMRACSLPHVTEYLAALPGTR